MRQGELRLVAFRGEKGWGGREPPKYILQQQRKNNMVINVWSLDPPPLSEPPVALMTKYYHRGLTKMIKHFTLSSITCQKMVDNFACTVEMSRLITVLPFWNVSGRKHPYALMVCAQFILILLFFLSTPEEFFENFIPNQDKNVESLKLKQHIQCFARYMSLHER